MRTTKQTKGETMTIMNVYRVYFLGVSTHSREDVSAHSKFEAEAAIAAKYGLAHSISSHQIKIAN